MRSTGRAAPTTIPRCSAITCCRGSSSSSAPSPGCSRRSTRIGFDDFRRNGLLLPARAEASHRLALPLHRGPHRAYSAMVGERVGQIEARWARECRRAPVSAGEEALFRLDLLQRALRRRLLDPPGARLRLNRHDPLGAGFHFAELDALAEALWGDTQAVLAESSAFAA